jgi:hypothetical protein
MSMRVLVAAAVLTVAGMGFATADSLREPLEKQFFDYFTKQCSDGLAAEAKAMNMDTAAAGVAEGINKYCTCTSQAIVSHLSAEEIISFAVDPTKDPAAATMKPYFEQCHGK